MIPTDIHEREPLLTWSARGTDRIRHVKFDLLHTSVAALRSDVDVATREFISENGMMFAEPWQIRWITVQVEGTITVVVAYDESLGRLFDAATHAWIDPVPFRWFARETDFSRDDGIKLTIETHLLGATISDALDSARPAIEAIGGWPELDAIIERLRVEIPE